MKFEYPLGSTPLDPEELLGLIPAFVSTQAELNAVEQMNIAKAEIWLLKNKRSVLDILDDFFLRELHKKMYGDVWMWAGKYRQSDKNIGVNWTKIPIFLRDLLDDVKYQINHKTYSEIEIAVRFHHRLVWIHLFPNGNGRHARILADFVLKKLNGGVLKWGGGDIHDYASACERRKKYIGALRLADKSNCQPLIDFATGNSWKIS